jgi:hypothetical protein
MATWVTSNLTLIDLAKTPVDRELIWSIKQQTYRTEEALGPGDRAPGYNIRRRPNSEGTLLDWTRRCLWTLPECASLILYTIIL